MKLDDLDEQERVVFGCLIRMMLRSDGQFTDEEEDQVRELGRELGLDEEQTWHMISLSAKSFPDEKAAKPEVAKVTREPVRALILGALDGIAGADGKAAEEEELLGWLRKTWS